MFQSQAAAVGFLLARALFAGVLGFLAVGNLLDLDSSVGYASAKGVPLAGVAVPAGSLTLLAGALSILVGVAPALGALAVVGFLVAVTPVMHDVWAQDGEDAQNEMVHFLKNAGLLAGALAFLLLSTVEWPYALGA
jgi:uncharacterized membrane protein YphA (DoxX/SURF4 family)